MHQAVLLPNMLYSVHAEKGSLKSGVARVGDLVHIACHTLLLGVPNCGIDLDCCCCPLVFTVWCVYQSLEFILLGKTEQAGGTDDEVPSHSSDELCSGDSSDHRLLSRVTRRI